MVFNKPQLIKQSVETKKGTKLFEPTIVAKKYLLKQEVSSRRSTTKHPYAGRGNIEY